MLKLFLCDDDPLHLQHVAAYIGSLSLDAEYALATFGEPSRVLARIREGVFPDIAVLDIEMPKVDGISLAEKLNQLCPRCKIIFLTGYTDYTYDAYYADHIWYVLKTDMEKYLPAALKKAIAGAGEAVPEPYLLLQQQRNDAARILLRKQLRDAADGQPDAAQKTDDAQPAHVPFAVQPPSALAQRPGRQDAPAVVVLHRAHRYAAQPRDLPGRVLRHSPSPPLQRHFST